MRLTPYIPLCTLAFSAATLAGFAQTTQPTDLAALNKQAQVAHGLRNLGEASALYKSILKVDTPVTPSASQREFILSFVPRLNHVPGEFFPLKDIVAIHHPDRPVIGYHLFWEDDIGYPSDNDPCDHEIVWVEYKPGSRKVVKVMTYFHGRVLSTPESVVDANQHGGRPWIAVEWGFHGSIPLGAIGKDPGVEKTLKHHLGMARDGKKFPRDPLARGWPEEYTGSYADFTTYTVPADPTAMLKERDLMYVSAWTNATINRYCLRYNFAAKLEWPWLWVPKETK